MQRFIPEFRALWERVRRPAIMFAIGIGLAAPAGSFIVRQDAAKAADLAAARAATASAKASASTPASGTDAAVNGRESDERQAALATLRMAQLFDVPLGLAKEIHSAADSAGIPARVAFGLVRTESSFRRTAVSPVGAVGYAQVMPATARWLEPGTKRSDLFETKTNLRLGFSYLDRLIDKYDGNLRLALTAYNRGPGTVDRLLRRGRDPENGYADKVLAAPKRSKSESRRRSGRS